MVLVGSPIFHKFFGHNGIFHNMRGGNSYSWKFERKNNSIFVAVFLVLFLFALLVAFKPAFFAYLFGTILGNILLVLFVFFIGIFDIKWALGLALFFLILHAFTRLPKNAVGKERFSGVGVGVGDGDSMNVGIITGGDVKGQKVSKPGLSSVNKEKQVWSDQTLQDFIHFENVTNPNYIFDLNILQQQASESDVQYLLKNGKWYWSKETQNLYINAVLENQLIRVDPGVSMSIDQTIYNENAMKQLLSMNTKEGLFLINGVTIGHSKNMPKDRPNTIRCYSQSQGKQEPSAVESSSYGTGVVQNRGQRTDEITNFDYIYMSEKPTSNSQSVSSGGGIMKKKIYKGYNAFNASANYDFTEVKNEDLPAEIPGFQFVGAPCNPCVALNSPADYSCAFKINTGNGWDISPIWRDLWNL